MCRLFTLIFTVFMFGVTSHAQETKDFQTTRVIRGAVIDNDGNPIPGATVSATNGAEYVTTDSDGSFSIEVPIWLKTLTASYPGLQNNKMKINAYDMMIFQLKSFNRTYGFVNLMFANVWQIKPTGGYNDKVQQLGLMGGAYRKWGGYAKIMMGLFATHNGSYEYPSHIQYNPTVTGGVIKPIQKSLNVFLGVGIGSNYNFDDRYSNGYILQEAQVGMAIEGGAMYKWKKVNGILGVTYITKSTDSPAYQRNSGNFSLFLGVGMNI